MSSEAFEQLVHEQARVMSAAIRRVCGRRHRDLIPDVEQEVRLALWKRLEGGKKIEHPVSYVYRVALTTAVAVMRRHDKGETAVNREYLESRDPHVPQPRELSPPERARLLEQVLARLPREQSRALRAYLAGFNHREIAGLFGWTESVARHRLYRGMNALSAVSAGAASHE